MAAAVIGRTGEAGTSLIETLIATGLLLVVLAGVSSMGLVAMTTTENQGHLAARTTEYAQDKMEQLLALASGDSTSDTRVFPATSGGGTGLAIGGSLAPGAPVAGYVDYLDPNGNLLASVGTTAPPGWFYERVWQISSPTANLKQITVTAIVAASLGRTQAPQSTIATLKTFPF
jgi:hypothetical protein